MYLLLSLLVVCKVGSYIRLDKSPFLPMCRYYNNTFFKRVVLISSLIFFFMLLFWVLVFVITHQLFPWMQCFLVWQQQRSQWLFGACLLFHCGWHIQILNVLFFCYSPSTHTELFAEIKKCQVMSVLHIHASAKSPVWQLCCALTGRTSLHLTWT